MFPLFRDDAVPTYSGTVTPTHEDPTEAYLGLHLRVLSRKLTAAEEDKILASMCSIWASLSMAQKKKVGIELYGAAWEKETMGGSLCPLDVSIWERLGSGKRY